jgi:hypothetical protein
MVGLVVKGLVENVGTGTKDCTKENRDKRKNCWKRLPATDVLKDNWYDAELHIDDPVAKGRIQGEQETYRCGEELHRPDEELPRQVTDTDVTFLELGVKCPVTSLMSKSTGFVDQELRRIRLIDQDDSEGENGELKNTCQILCPSPAKARLYYNSSGDDWS